MKTGYTFVKKNKLKRKYALSEYQSGRKQRQTEEEIRFKRNIRAEGTKTQRESGEEKFKRKSLETGVEKQKMIKELVREKRESKNLGRKEKD